jgi:uncharacterized paraquat-inducible protein A
MTPTTATRIDLRELPTLDIRCNKCGSVVSLTLPRDNAAQDLSCAGCETVLWRYQEPAHTAVTGLLRTISHWKSSGNGMPFTLGFSLASVRAANEKD